MNLINKMLAKREKIVLSIQYGLLISYALLTAYKLIPFSDEIITIAGNYGLLFDFDSYIGKCQNLFKNYKWTDCFNWKCNYLAFHKKFIFCQIYKFSYFAYCKLFFVTQITNSKFK